MPTSWNDLNMDWDAPDASNPAYLRAIEMAIIERRSVANQYQSVPPFVSHPADIINYSWAQKIRSAVYDLIYNYAFLIIDPTKTIADEDYYNNNTRVLLDDQKILDLNAIPGDLLNSISSQKFLQACKYFLDKLTVHNSTYQYGNYLQYDYYHTVGSPYPHPDNWSDVWDWCAANVFEVLDDAPWTQAYLEISAKFTHGDYSLGYFKNIRYIPRTRLAHDLIMFSSGAVDSTNVFFDLGGYGLAQGWSKALSITKDGPDSEWTISDAAPKKPTFPAWGNISENNLYSWNFEAYGILDYGVEDGFAFQGDPVSS